MNAVVLSPRSPRKRLSGHIGSFVKAIRPAIAKTTGELDDRLIKLWLRMFSIKLK